MGTLEQLACEDLKAFERRITEVVSYMQPASTRWRFLLVVTFVCTAIGAYQWLIDPLTSELSLFNSLYQHMYFTISLTALLILFLCGIHKRVVAPSIIAARCRQVLTEFSMSCDDTGKLILKPRPTTP